MKSTALACLALLFWGLASSVADACWCCPCMVYYCPPPPCCVAYETRVVTCYQPQWKEEKIPIEIQKVNYRAEKYQVKVTEYVPQMFDQSVRTSYYVPVPKVVQQDVARCVMVPMMAVDPCTGCCYMSCCPQWVTYKVQYNVCDYVLQSRDDVVKVCKMVPQERVVDQVRYIPVVTKEKSWTVQRTCIMVPYQTTVNVPVYVPCCP